LIFIAAEKEGKKMAELVHVICGILSVACAVLLLRNYRRTRSRLLLWTSLSFAFLALNNVFVFADLIVFADVELGGRIVRNGLNSLAGGVMLFGLIWEIT
jgi:hypothetical protein